MDVCGETGWTDGHCHPDRVGGCCTLLLKKPQSDYCPNQFLLQIILSHVGSGSELLHYYVHISFKCCPLLI